MKQFLSIFSEILGELDKQNTISSEKTDQMELKYKRLSDMEQDKSLEIICDLLQDNYDVKVYLLSTLLSLSNDKKVLRCLEDTLCAKENSLWFRLNDQQNMKAHLFRYPNLYDEKEEYLKLKKIYIDLLDEIQKKMKNNYPYIPYTEREKNIVIVVKVLLAAKHAPTRITRYVYNYFRKMGYHTECFVCCLDGKGFWHVQYKSNNFINKTTGFCYNIDEKNQIEGFNFQLHSDDYVENLNLAVGMIWNRKPEFVFEIGDETILAGLCNNFTTVVTMGCTKNLPVTNAPLIAAFVEYSGHDKQLHKCILHDKQSVISVECDFLELNETESKVQYLKQTFGFSKDDFVIIIAGNRLDYEVNGLFLKIIEQILERDKHFVIAFIGECQELKEKTVKINEERIRFLGGQDHFREAIGIGDLFLNPPRQGGGTGGLYAILEEVPVITLDNCDVEVNAGSDFVCGSIEEMPGLVYKYFSDAVFMEKQKENCRKRAKIMTGTGKKQSLLMLCDTVKEYALRTEQNHIKYNCVDKRQRGM